jgi:hypothetical protein
MNLNLYIETRHLFKALPLRVCTWLITIWDPALYSLLQLQSFNPLGETKEN